MNFVIYHTNGLQKKFQKTLLVLLHNSFKILENPKVNTTNKQTSKGGHILATGISFCFRLEAEVSIFAFVAAVTLYIVTTTNTQSTIFILWSMINHRELSGEAKNQIPCNKITVNLSIRRYSIILLFSLLITLKNTCLICHKLMFTINNKLNTSQEKNTMYQLIFKISYGLKSFSNEKLTSLTLSQNKNSKINFHRTLCTYL